jgi:hypothetical protein
LITQIRTLEIFRDHLPEHTIIRVLPAVQYVDVSLKQPYIQRQIEVGVYDQESVYIDFLAAARVYAPFRLADVCYELFANQFHGLTPELAEGLVRWTAVHEAHHFDPMNLAIVDEAERELHCNRVIAARYPDVQAVMDEVELKSHVFQRVYARVEGLEPVT